MHRSMLAASPVPAAVAGSAIATSLVTELANAGHITAQFNFDYGSGGTSATYWLQTSLDGGATWIDIACVQFTTADAVKIVNIDAGGYVSPGYTPGDGVLAVGSVVDGIMGDRLRIKQTIVGTYAASTIAVDIVDKAGVGGPKTVTQVGAPAALGQAAASASMPVVNAAGSTDVIQVTPAISAAAYSSGDVYGGVIAIPGFFRSTDLSAALHSLTVIDRSNHTGSAMTIHFFSATPASAVADNGAFAWGTGDGDLWIGFVDILASEYKTFGARQLVTKTGIGLDLKGAGTTLYAYAVLNGTPTYAVGDLTFGFGPLRS